MQNDSNTIAVSVEIQLKKTTLHEYVSWLKFANTKTRNKLV